MKKIEERKTYTNPVLPGFYPDPSICRVGEDYYLVNSSFAYFPGIPIFHSKDLVHWHQIGHVLDRSSQLNLGSVGHSRGIFAPTIRYNDGIFYLITTSVDGRGNFIVTSETPEGDWSDPHWLADAPGIDPSLFFDDDGQAYYTGARPSVSGESYDGDWEIWLQEIDLEKMELQGEKYTLWKGALRDARWPEGPHIYKKDDYYYLMIAEGGTNHQHAVTVARSKEIKGPYQGNPANPVLTHRHLGKDYPIVNVGHGDLVYTQNKEWWMVVLASRPYGGYYRNLGRETFLLPLIWEDGWPIMSPGSGKLEFKYRCPDLPGRRWPAEKSCDNFDGKELNYIWNSLRSSIKGSYDLNARPGYLRLYLKPEKLIELTSPAFIGRRQQHKNFYAVTKMEFAPEKEEEVAGLVVLQSNEYHYSLLRSSAGGKQLIRLLRCADSKETVLAEEEYSSELIYLKVEAHGQDYSFYYGRAFDELRVLKENVDGRILSTDAAGGFVGTYIGMYASSNNTESNNYADFDWFEYRGI
ncbi:MAG TPA: glycoside hydrolase family 43 protein [Halanaerobiales bacterium]|nr:glycoside hydrolase family 43 protein [Halanaerobiales bacterium]